MRLLLTILWTIGVVSLQAQPVKPDRDHVSVRFRAMSFDDPIPEASYLSGERLHRIDIPTDSFTPEYTYAGSGNLRFVTIDPKSKKPASVSPALQNALQRLRRAQAATLQISQEHEQTMEFLQKFQLRTTEDNRKPTSGDLAQLQALSLRLQELAAALTANAKETEEANLTVLRLEAIPEPTAPPTVQSELKQSALPSAPTTECTFHKDGNYLLIFYAAGNGYQIMTLEDNNDAFPYGSQQFINLTGLTVAVVAEEVRLTLKSNTRGTLLNKGADFGYSLRQIHAESQDAPLSGRTLRILRNPDLRTLTFLLPDPDNPQSIRYRSVEDVRPPTVDKAKR
jgi:hypothetical protein